MQVSKTTITKIDTLIKKMVNLTYFDERTHRRA